mmetsp:Transcript_7532/g.13735  ORF Transcript_7532/g.13735 Transcript_7532/m.13735 type:complete len:105 (+) Transcript_7532:2454-2768(+)
MCCGLDRAGYVRRADVLNRGFSGYNSRWAKEILDRIGTDDLCLATVLLGASKWVDVVCLLGGVYLVGWVMQTTHRMVHRTYQWKSIRRMCVVLFLISQGVDVYC